MKKLSYLLTLLLLVTLMTGCKAFHTLMDSKLKTAQGAPYELIVVCNQQLWESELGDTLRSVLLAPIPYLNEREPLFNVMQFPESGFKGTVVDYRNILKVLVDPSLAAASAGVHYDVGVFTNLSPDHIGPGEHKTFEEYRSWKGQLFQRCDVGVVNIDDENTEALLEGHTCKLVTYGRSEKADYRAEGCELLRTHDFLGVQFHVSGKDDMDVKVNMPGEFSVYNALAALAVGKVLGLPDAAIHEGLGKCVVKGRVELVPISKKFTILLDYAHNEVSTESLLTTLRAYHPHRLVVVFGCGGNRSKLRRYGMGEICAKMADFSILTEDNNRFEKVEDILADIRVGMNKGNPEAKFVEIPDRLDALHYAVDHTQEGDLIAVIGKGHETYRDREGVKTPFLERELLEEYAQQKGLE